MYGHNHGIGNLTNAQSIREFDKRSPWGPAEVETDFFFKILNRLEQTLQATPHMAPFASFEKSRFSEALGTL